MYIYVVLLDHPSKSDYVSSMGNEGNWIYLSLSLQMEIVGDIVYSMKT
jgi:hypothetical protein